MPGGGGSTSTCTAGCGFGGEVLTATEEHGHGRRLVAVRATMRITRLARLSLGCCAAVAVGACLAGAPEIATVALGSGLAHVVGVWLAGARLGDAIGHAVEGAAADLGLVPVEAGRRA